jgi:hypothetical protein
LESKMNNKIDNTKYWLKKYNETMITLDQQLGIVKQIVQNNQDKIESEVERCSKKADFKRHFA